MRLVVLETNIFSVIAVFGVFKNLLNEVYIFLNISRISRLGVEIFIWGGG